MITAPIDELALLDEHAAVERHFDARNYRALRWLLLVALFTGFVVTLVAAGEGRPLGGLVAFLGAAGAGAMFLFRRTDLFRRNFRPLLVTWLLFEYAALLLALPEWGWSLALSAFAFPLLVLFLRFPPSQVLALLAVFYLTGMAAALWLQNARGMGAVIGEAVGRLFLLSVIGAVAVFLALRERRAFVPLWASAARKERDRLRMRGELADARRIQLAMLPEAAPELDWIGLAGTSLPATEVGGDFFDFYELGEGRVAIVIGDVAGHGVASGLVLASVKSALFLLRDALAAPASVLARLDAVVREATRWRMLVSMLIVVVDRDARSAQVVSAGHPPLLCVDHGSMRVRRIGLPALPLGTRLGAEFREEVIDLGDVTTLLLVTDGVVEASSADGTEFGDERLEAVLLEAAGRESAAAVRDGVVEGVERHAAGSARSDDITLVAARILLAPVR